ncbi:MAG: hypothetical protein WEB56_12105 [Roseovarius sp.]
MFKQSVGVPPRVYLTRLRVEKACELLEQTNRPIIAGWCAIRCAPTRCGDARFSKPEPRERMSVTQGVSPLT